MLNLVLAIIAAIGIHTNSFERDGVIYAQRGGLGAADYVVTNIDASAVGKVQSVNGKTGDVVLNASDVGALPLVEDANSNKTAVTIGSRKAGKTVGQHSLANGYEVTASGEHAHSEGYYAIASGNYSHAEGFYAHTKAQDRHAFAWNGDEARIAPYESHGAGTFNINPYGGMDGFYIGEQTLSSILTNKADKASISATDTTFSNAVLAVGLNIDTNSVAVLNEIASTFGGFPIEGTATTVGGLLAALAAAVAWLKKNKVGSFASVGGASATVENGVAKLDDFFTEPNSLLIGLIASKTIGKADKDAVLPRYYFTILEVVDGVVTIPPYTSATMPGDGTAFTVAVGEGNGYMRDCILIVECGDVAPTITWPANFHPRTDAETDFACVAGVNNVHVNNVYWISEYVQGEFVVAGWQATAGGSAV